MASGALANDEGDAALRRAAVLRRRGALISRRVAGLLDLARREQRPIRIRCLDRALSQINSVRRAMASRGAHLETAVRARDRARREHALSVLGVLDGRLRRLEGEARVCAGDTPVTGSRTVVTVTIDRSVPDDDPTRRRRRHARLPWLPPPTSPAL